MVLDLDELLDLVLTPARKLSAISACLATKRAVNADPSPDFIICSFATPKYFSTRDLSMFKPSLNGIFNPNTKKEINEILESLKYFNTYNFLKKKFGENNIKIFSYELLKLNRNKFFLEICNYLNINPSIISVIQNSSYENKFSYKKVSLINSIIYNIKNYKNLIRYLPTKIVSFFNFLLFDYIQGKIRLIKLARTKFNSQNKKKILEFYKEDNLKLQSEIKINLL